MILLALSMQSIFFFCLDFKAQSNVASVSLFCAVTPLWAPLLSCLVSRANVSYSVAPTAEVIDVHFFINLSFYGNNTETQLELISPRWRLKSKVKWVKVNTALLFSNAVRIESVCLCGLSVCQVCVSELWPSVKAEAPCFRQRDTLRICFFPWFPFENIIHVKKKSQTHNFVSSRIPPGGLIRPIVRSSAEFDHYAWKVKQCRQMCKESRVADSAHSLWGHQRSDTDWWGGGDQIWPSVDG